MAAQVVEEIEFAAQPLAGKERPQRRIQGLFILAAGSRVCVVTRTRKYRVPAGRPVIRGHTQGYIAQGFPVHFA